MVRFLRGCILPSRDPRAMSPAKLRHKFPLFVEFEPSEFESLEKCLVRRRYPGGQALFHMGDEGGSLHLIERGRVKVTIPSYSGEELILAILGAGDLLGPLSPFHRKPPPAWRRKSSPAEPPSASGRGGRSGSE